MQLSAHFLPGSIDDQLGEWLALKPRVIKFASIDEDWLKWNGAVLAQVPAGVTLILKRVETPPSFETADPAQAARDYAAPFSPFIDAVSAYTPLAHVVFEGLNEIGINPDQPTLMAQFITFEAEFCRAMARQGARAGVPCWAVGNPPETAQLAGWAPVLQAILECNALYTLHEYGPIDENYSLRHRQHHRLFASLGYPDVPMAITECGADGLGLPGWEQWRVMFNGDAQRYVDEYLWPLEIELRKDADYLIGATIFTVNDGGAWGGFDVAHCGLPARLAAHDKETPVDIQYSYYTSIIQGAVNKESLMDFDIRVHDWLTKHNGDITGFPGTWWAGKATPFTAYSRPDMERFIAIFKSETDTLPSFRKVSYPMSVSKISANGLRFKVFESPEMWIMAGQTQGAP